MAKKKAGSAKKGGKKGAKKKSGKSGSKKKKSGALDDDPMGVANPTAAVATTGAPAEGDGNDVAGAEDSKPVRVEALCVLCICGLQADIFRAQLCTTMTCIQTSLKPCSTGLVHNRRFSVGGSLNILCP